MAVSTQAQVEGDFLLARLAHAGGYGGTRTCPTCKGTGINPVLPVNVCPKCRGETKVRA